MADTNSPYVLWPPSSRQRCNAEERAAYFSALCQEEAVDTNGLLPRGKQASTLKELMIIRAFHSHVLRHCSLGTALGFRIRDGTLTDIPAVLVFVGRKVHLRWLLDVQRLPITLQGPGGVWCDLDVVEFSYFGNPAVSHKEQFYSELLEALRGCDSSIGSGSQVASQETYGTMACIVRSLTPEHELGFLTNRHVAVHLDNPHQKMFHPLPPNLGPGVYLGSVERATSFITDDLWYGGIFAGLNEETFIRADGAFIPFAKSFDLRTITADLKGAGEMGDIVRIDLDAPIGSIMGQHVVKVGRSSGLTKGVIRAYALEYNDEREICYFSDFLIVGENDQPFDSVGDNGSLILLAGKEDEKPRPFGIMWGGSPNRGLLKLCNGRAPETWTSCVDLGRLLDLLQLELITTQSRLEGAIEEHWQIHHPAHQEGENGNSAYESNYWDYMKERDDLERIPCTAFAPPEEVAYRQLMKAKRTDPPSCTPSCTESHSSITSQRVDLARGNQREKQIKDGDERPEDRLFRISDTEGKRKRLCR